MQGRISDAKDQLLDDAKDINTATREELRMISDAMIDMAVRQPRHTERITERLSDAPQRYAELDPNECLAFKYPSGMRNEVREAIRSHLASLPKFDNSGQRIFYPTIDQRP